jgi:ribosomal protein S18 acetylase RimI-like enzyme
VSVNHLEFRQYRGHSDDAALAEIARVATGEPYPATKVAYDLSVPGINQEKDITLCEMEGQVIGYAQVVIDNVKDVRQGRLICRLVKNTASDQLVVREMLLWAARRMQDEIREDGRPVSIIELVKEEDFARREFLENSGFLAIRYYWIMLLREAGSASEVPLPKSHAYIHGPGAQGAREYVAMFNETWIDHYGFIPLTVESFLHDINDDPEYSPSLDIVVSRNDGRFVGFAFCRLEGSDAQLGEVMAIGTRRGSRGIGLGRAMLTHSVRQLVRMGATQVELTVDSENPTGAERLYESVGFEVTSMKRRYQLSQDGVIRLATFSAC